MKVTSLFFISSLLIFQTTQAGIFSHHAAKDDATASDKTTTATSSNDSKGAVEKKLDYKLSFKRPYYYNDQIPFWSTGGDVITAPDRIRLSPSVPGTKGWIWSDLKNDYKDWMVEMTFRVSGNQVHGGRGMALWYTKDKLPEGPVFGAKDEWEGLSIWFDSANPKTHTPTIMAFMNDGKFAFASPGVDPTKRALATCSIDYRNSPDTVKMALYYKDKTLTLLVDPTSQGMNYRPCFQQHDLSLPTGYHFGVTAASHNPADDHDVLSFETYQMNPPAKLTSQKRPLEEEKTQKGEEFKELTEEQRKKIEEAEFEIRRLRAQSNEANILSETAATLGTLYDTERRILETLQINQMQLEALGAPTPEQVLSGNFEQKPVSTKDVKSQESSGISVDHLKIETKTIVQRLEQQANQQDQQLKEMQDTVSRMEKLIQAMDNRLALQNTNLHGKLSEITKGSEEARGTMSTLIKYVLYACGLQATVGLAVYIYWKLRVERNEKKFL